MVQASTHGIRQAVQRVDRSTARADNRALRTALQAFVRAVVLNTPIRTGDLRSSLRVMISGGVITIRYTIHYAGYVQYRPNRSQGFFTRAINVGITQARRRGLRLQLTRIQGTGQGGLVARLRILAEDARVPPQRTRIDRGRRI